MERWLFAGFLLLAAAQDLERKQVDIWIYLLFGGAALAIGIGRKMAGSGEYVWIEHLGGVGLGLGLLAASAVSRGGIGTGDGWFFVVSGLFLGFWENLMMLCYGVLLCGIFCLGYLIWCRFHQVSDVRETSHTISAVRGAAGSLAGDARLEIRVEQEGMAMKQKKLQAGYTVEALTGVMSLVFVTIMILMNQAFRIHAETVGAFALHKEVEQQRHAVEHISEGEITGKACGSTWELEITAPVFRPEETLRMWSLTEEIE